uniref:Nuclear pore glycoprotein p62 n=1 Tax=Knipowitschia caucasica TaxID=637954 RepID=A0AAV2K3Z0_KNICA
MPVWTVGEPGTGGFSFGQPTTAAPTPGFGMPASTTAPAGGGFTFGNAAQPSANPTGGFSFGTPAKSTASGGGFSFGTTTGSFGLAPAPQTTTGMTLGSTTAPAAGAGFTMGGGLSAQTPAAAPTGGGFSFGATPQTQQPAAAPAVTSSTAGFGGFSFGTKGQATTAAAPTTATGGGFTFLSTAPSTLTLGSQPAAPTAATTTTAPPQPADFSLGIKPSTTPAPPAITQVAPSAAASLFSLTTPASSAAPTLGTGFALPIAPTSIAASAASATTTAAGGLSLMLKPLGAATTAATSTAAAAAAPTASAPAAAAAVTVGATPGFTLGLKPTTSIAATTSAAAIPSTTTTAAPPVMTYAQLEGLINKWSLELEDQERHFLQQATQVNAWDRMLVENGEKITSLHKEMEKVKLDQRRLNQELDFILSQQKELEDLLCPLEESVKEQSGTIYMQNADEERERTYKLAENVDAQLKRMSQDLKEIIEHLNTSSGPADTSDPLQQICKILNAHMDSLQWVDQNSVLLQRRVEEVSKMCDNQRKEQEKTFRLTFD